MAATGGLVRRKSIVGSNSQIPSIFQLILRYYHTPEEICRWLLLFEQLQLFGSNRRVQKASTTTFQYWLGAQQCGKGLHGDSQVSRCC